MAKMITCKSGSKQGNPICIFSNNQSVIAFNENLKFHTRSKHIHIKVHFVKEYVQAKEIKVDYYTTFLRDDFRHFHKFKVLLRDKHEHCTKLMKHTKSVIRRIHLTLIRKDFSPLTSTSL
jgi:hypothetical protein